MKAKTLKLKHTKRRGTKGVSITELLVTSILLGVSLAAVAEVMSMCVLANSKLTRQMDTQSSMRVAIDRLKRDVRMANEIVLTSPEFPGEYTNAQTLIMHLPIYYLDKKNDPGSTEYVSSAPQNALNGVPLPGYDAVMYKVIADPDPLKPNQFVMQITRRNPQSPPNYKADTSCSYTSEIFPAQQIISGIIGPTEPNSLPGSVPRIFSYLCRNSNGGVATLSTSASFVPNALSGTTGVGIDIEVRQYNSSTTQQQTAFDDVRGTHAEVFIRLPKAELGMTDQSYYELN